MPQRSLSPLRLRGGAAAAPPPVMTWPEAIPVIVVAFIFDLVRAFFHLFWFFGPAVAALYCTLEVSARLSSWTFGLLGTKAAAIVCSGAAAVGGAAAVEVTAPIGVIMAGATGFVAFLVLGLWVSMRNMRILKKIAGAPVQFAAAFAASEIPFLGTLPFFSFILWRLYGKQIRIETASLKKWQEETAAARLQEQRQQASAVAQMQAGQMQADVQQRQIIAREEAEFAAYQERLAANDGQYKIPIDEQGAANDNEYTQKATGT